MGHLDRSLNRLLVALAEGLAASRQDLIRVHLGDWPDATADCLDVFCRSGLLREADPERATICDGCDRGCTMEVAWCADPDEPNARPFIVCDKRDDIGRVPVDTERLRSWHFSMEQIASAVSTLLGTSQPPTAVDRGRTWRMGAVGHGARIVEASLSPSEREGPIDCNFRIVLEVSKSEPRGSGISLAHLVAFRDHRLVLNRAALRSALGTRFGDPRTACEIKLERGEIVLINHVTAEVWTIARPDFDSANDNVFQTLFDNPERKFSLAELKKFAGKRALTGLHKIPENLNFDGPLKKLFFRVSKDAISFSRTATVGQMATLGIDPKRI